MVRQSPTLHAMRPHQPLIYHPTCPGTCPIMRMQWCMPGISNGQETLVRAYSCEMLWYWIPIYIYRFFDFPGICRVLRHVLRTWLVTACKWYTNGLNSWPLDDSKGPITRWLQGHHLAVVRCWIIVESGWEWWTPFWLREVVRCGSVCGGSM